MATHRYHPDPDRADPRDAILWDDCDRCSEHAERLSSLDGSHARRLYHLMRDVKQGNGTYCTRNEARAASNLWNACLLLQHAGVLTRVMEEVSR